MTIPSERTKRPFRVSIEGNIGAGKSTLIKYFESNSNVDTFSEPVQDWQNLNGHNLLNLMYSDLPRWNFLFRSYVQLTFLQNQMTPPSHSKITVQIFERSVQSNRYGFVKHAYKAGFLNKAEYAVIDSWYETITNLTDLNLDLIVYLQTKPEIVYKRMLERARPEEETVPLNYLQELHQVHEEWLVNPKTNTEVPVLVLDGNQSIEQMRAEYMKHSDILLGIKKLPLTQEDASVE